MARSDHQHRTAHPSGGTRSEKPLTILGCFRMEYKIRFDASAFFLVLAFGPLFWGAPLRVQVSEVAAHFTGL
ncbi:hypothetical protein E4U30_002406 [Claviceps sp. LM220 group G6]|nr:hypothetical protein E4U15_005718 [Claviceps sp. LM218 group G6]KAG6094072.1 hypothetical protein E4U31_006447 [Claviceps sp. LM219 group G6]KAG6095532.1 hypothetical protein E4U30_002406 [Claviceps sp. LM220 group G6]